MSSPYLRYNQVRRLPELQLLDVADRNGLFRQAQIVAQLTKSDRMRVRMLDTDEVRELDRSLPRFARHQSVSTGEAVHRVGDIIQINPETHEVWERETWTFGEVVWTTGAQLLVLFFAPGGQMEACLAWIHEKDKDEVRGKQCAEGRRAFVGKSVFVEREWKRWLSLPAYRRRELISALKHPLMRVGLRGDARDEMYGVAAMREQLYGVNNMLAILPVNCFTEMGEIQNADYYICLQLAGNGLGLHVLVLERKQLRAWLCIWQELTDDLQQKVQQCGTQYVNIARRRVRDGEWDLRVPDLKVPKPESGMEEQLKNCRLQQLSCALSVMEQLGGELGSPDFQTACHVEQALCEHTERVSWEDMYGVLQSRELNFSDEDGCALTEPGMV